jgi:hypothetical protein
MVSGRLSGLPGANTIQRQAGKHAPQDGIPLAGGKANC